MLSNKYQVFILLALATAVMIVVGCGQKTLPTPTPTTTSTVVNTPTLTLPATPTKPVASPVPTLTLPPARLTPRPSPVFTTHVVQEGDTLSDIALEYGVTVGAIITANKLASDIIYPGQVLTIPLESAELHLTPTPAASPYVRPTAVPHAAPTLPPVEPILITHGDRSLPYIALTFDACQTSDKPAGYDADIINTLTETHTAATLFLGGLWMQSHPTQTQKLSTNTLFELGNHSWSHPDFSEISPEKISTEILRTQDIMYKLTGQQPTLFRLPFGTYTDEALAVIAQHGLRIIQWDVVTGDPDPNISEEDIVNTVTTEAHNGSIVIMHMNTRGWHTAEALPTIIKLLRAQGYMFVTVSQLLDLDLLPTPKNE